MANFGWVERHNDQATSWELVIPGFRALITSYFNDRYHYMVNEEYVSYPVGSLVQAKQAVYSSIEKQVEKYIKQAETALKAQAALKGVMG